MSPLSRATISGQPGPQTEFLRTAADICTPGIEIPRAISVTFIPAKVFDNPALLQVNPEYLAWLLSLPLLERERLLSGNWKIRPAARRAALVAGRSMRAPVRLSSYAMRNEAETAEARTIKRRLQHGYRGVRVMHLDLSDDERRPPRGAATAHRRVGSAPAYRIGERENGRSEPRLGGPD
jgi:hypothetical protein